MSIFSGSTEILDVYSGSTPVQKVYSGSDLVWQRALLSTTITSGNVSTTWGYTAPTVSNVGSIGNDTFSGTEQIALVARSSTSNISFHLFGTGKAASPPFSGIILADGTVLTPGAATSTGEPGGTRTSWLWSFSSNPELSGKTPTSVIPDSGTWDFKVI